MGRKLDYLPFPCDSLELGIVYSPVKDLEKGCSHI